jgi:PAS domain S-box-containing protein
MSKSNAETDEASTGRETTGRFDQKLREANARIRELTSELDSYRQREMALRESEERFRSLADNIAQLAWMADASGWTFWYNQRWYEYTGTTLDEMEGWGWQTVPHPDHIQRVVGKIRHCFETGETWEDTFPLRGRDGSYRWFLSRAVPMRDVQGKILRWFGTNTDVTEQRAAENALARSEAILNSVLQALPIGVVIADRGGKIISTNDATYRLWGLPPETTSWEQYGEWVGYWPNSGERIKADEWAMSRALLKGETVVGELVECESFGTGERRYILNNAAPIRDSTGQIIAGVVAALDVTERLAAERALRESEERFRTMADGLPLIIWVHDAEGQQQFVNRTFCEFFGVSAEEMKGGRWQVLMHPDDAEPYSREFLACLRERRPFHAETRVRSADGQWRWIESWARPRWSASGDFLGFVGTSADITERRAAEAALLESEAQARARAEELAAVMEAVPAFMFLAHDRECREMSSSRATRKLLRLPEGTDVSRSALAPDEPTSYRAMKDGRELVPEELPVQMAAATGRDVRDFELTIAFDDGTKREIFGNAVPLFDPRGEVRGAVGAFVDITERKRAEEALEKANEQLEAKVRERTIELSNLVNVLRQEVKQRKEAEHQLRQQANQLRALAGELTLAEQRERRRLGKILHDHLQQLLVGAKFRLAILARTGDDVIREAVAEIDRLLAESIDVSRSLTAELSPPILQEGGLHAGLEWLARWMRDKHALRVDILAQDALPNLPNDMAALVFESLRELLFNTVKHARVSSATITIRQLREDSLRIQVRDEGRGFDPKRVEPSSVAGGFGLFSIRERLSLIGGEVEIDAAPGQGTRVLLTVPIEKGPAVELPIPPSGTNRANERSVPAVRRSGTPIRVLLADDHAVVRDGLAQVLGQEPDIEIVGQATDGHEAADLARRLRPDIILMDVSMPRLNGIEATRLIHDEFPEIPIIGLSMFEEDDRAQAMRQAGAADYRSKSGSTADLLDAIRSNSDSRPGG